LDNLQVFGAIFKILDKGFINFDIVHWQVFDPAQEE
jgi:hypothetical protein